MRDQARFIGIYLLGVLFLLFDQSLKYFAKHNVEFSKYLVDPWIGWEYFANRGIAFSIPVPGEFVLIITPLLLILLLAFSTRQNNILTLKKHFGFALLISGAISNYIDRFLFQFTIDYIRIITSIINLADIMIITGIILVFYDSVFKIKK